MKILGAIIFFVCFVLMPVYAGGPVLAPDGQPWLSMPNVLVSPQGRAWHAAPGGLMVDPGGKTYIRRLPQPVYPDIDSTPGWSVTPRSGRAPKGAPGFDDPYNPDLLHY